MIVYDIVCTCDDPEARGSLVGVQQTHGRDGLDYQIVFEPIEFFDAIFDEEGVAHNFVREI